MKITRNRLRKLVEASLNERVGPDYFKKQKEFAKEFAAWEREQSKTNKLYTTYDEVQAELYNMYIEKAEELEKKHDLEGYSQKLKDALKNTDDDIKLIMGEIRKNAR